jgi:hypothetical protein
VLDLSLGLGGYFYGDHLKLKNQYEQDKVPRYLQNYWNTQFYDNKEIQIFELNSDHALRT